MALVACEPEATPLPVNLPTRAVVTDTPAAPQTPRYAIAPDALPYLTAEDRRLISASAEIVPYEETGDYALVVSLTPLPDGTQAPDPLHLSLIVNTALPPLDAPQIEQIVRMAVDPQQLAQALGIPPDLAGAAPTLTTQALRSDLANAGYPDGFDLTLAAEIPSIAGNLAAQLAAVGIQARIVPAGEPAHLTLTTGALSPQAIPLLYLPVYFRAQEGLTVTFAPSGFPIIRR